MAEFVVPYQGLLVASAVLAALVLVQVLVNDLAGIRARHIPGMPVVADHGDFHFRASRAIANTNENLPVQILLLFLAIGLAADPKWSSWAAWAFTLARLGHMVFYYLDLRLARSVAFGLGLVAQFVLLFVIGLAVGQ